jgi:hypothetical protein
VDVRPEWVAAEPAHEVAQRRHDFHSRALARKHCSVETSSLARGRGDERLHVGVAADDAVERDDIGGRNRIAERDEISVHERHPVGVSSSLRFLARGAHVRSRGVDVNGRASAVGQQLMVDDADARSNVEHRCVTDARAAQRGEQHPRRLVRPLPAVAPQLLRCMPVVERRLVTFGCAAGHSSTRLVGSTP